MNAAFSQRHATGDDAEAVAAWSREIGYAQRRVLACVALILGWAVFSSGSAQGTPPPPDESAIAEADTKFLKSFADPFLADGFDFPVGDANGQGKYRNSGSKVSHSWRVAVNFVESGIQTGEDWDGEGDSDLGQPVYSIGNGRVIYAQEGIAPHGNMVVIEHQFLENGKLSTVFSHYSRLKDVLVTKDQNVKRRVKIGTVGKGTADSFPAYLHFEIRKANAAALGPEFSPSAERWSEDQIRAHYEAPSLFIKARRKLTHPATMPELLLAVKHRFQLHRFQNGAITKTYEIALSQNPAGHKLTEGDLRMPEGEYHIIQKAKGPFSGPSWMKYLGAAWLRIDYPNRSDAAAALSEKRITQPVHDAIERAHRTGKMPPQDSALGGGIGVHGWKSPGWNPAGDRRITWGCISLNEADLLKLTAETKLGTAIIIVP